MQYVYPKHLPISNYLGEIKYTIQNNQVVIISGETGSGKTTQLPKLLLELGYAKDLLIGHTQPRRLATKTISHRIAKELDNNDVVAYKIRFQDTIKSSTKIKLMTDGILLQEIQNDRLLSKYSALIIDEAHERSLNIDFILGFLKQLIIKRTDIKIIITSATIENIKFSSFFNLAPIVNVPGKVYPVDIIYQPLDNDLEDGLLNLNEAIYKALSIHFKNGVALVFLPGEREIKDCIHYLKRTNLNKYQILPLFSRQNEQEQNLIFKTNLSKIIISTNIAETSLTIDGVVLVVDTGLAKVKRYNFRTKVEQLQIEKISQASCIQRTGRAGRVMNGTCIRLFSLEDFNLRVKYPDPEIYRSNLTNVILKLLVLKLGKIQEFPFIDAPINKHFNDGYRTLYELKAIDETMNITNFGKDIAKIPIDAFLSTMLINAVKLNNPDILQYVLIITSFLSIMDPREYFKEYQDTIINKQRIWQDDKSDFISILNLWIWIVENINNKKSNKSLQDKFKEHFLSYTRIKEWIELHNQLKEILTIYFKIKISSTLINVNTINSNYQIIHTIILTGIITNFGKKDEKGNYYNSTNNRKFFIHPSSLINKNCRWVCALQLILTSKLYARINAYIEPKWLLSISSHLSKFTISHEHWSTKRCQVIAKKTTILYGIIIYDEYILFKTIDQEKAHEIFIKEAIIANNLAKRFDFIHHNEEIINKIEEVENKFRYEVLILEDELFQFYKQKLSIDVVDIKSLENYLSINDKNILNLNFEILKNKLELKEEELILYPDYINISGEQIPLTYIFNYNNLNDGVTANINIGLINNINSQDFLWLIKGFIRDKIAFIFKSLPKNIKINLINQKFLITKFLEECNYKNNFYLELQIFINKHLSNNLSISIDYLESINLPPYLKFHFNIIENEHIIASGDDMELLKKQLQPRVNALLEVHSKKNITIVITDFIEELNNLLTSKKIIIANNEIISYYTLIVKENIVYFTLVNNLNEAIANTKIGIFYLVKMALANKTKSLKTKGFYHLREIILNFIDIYDKEMLIDDSINYIVKMSSLINYIPKNKQEFNEIVLLANNNFSQATIRYSSLIYAISNLYKILKLKINRHPLEHEIMQYLDDLLYTNFLKYVKLKYLENYPRYLEAVLVRLERYYKNIEKDKFLSNEIDIIYDAWYRLIDELELKGKFISDEIFEFKYKIEELRISLFAPNIKTLYTVSVKRLANELSLIKDNVV